VETAQVPGQGHHSKAADGAPFAELLVEYYAQARAGDPERRLGTKLNPVRIPRFPSRFPARTGGALLRERSFSLESALGGIGLGSSELDRLLGPILTDQEGSEAG
jgi:hypothetical protein